MTILAGEACKILNVSKRTLYRWEEEGRVKSVRDGVLKTRVFDLEYIKMVKKIMDLEEREKAHLAKLPEVLSQSRKHMLEQDYFPGKKLKLRTLLDVEKARKAFADEEAWTAEHKRILSEFFNYPRDILKQVLKIS